MSKCSCYGCDEDKSKAMYSIDYDGLIEKLEETRNELDTVIKILKDRKEKDNIINTILSEEYEDDEEIEEKKIDVDELLKTIKEMQNQQYKKQYPYRYYWYYPWMTL